MDIPPPRLAHTTVLYQSTIRVFSGGNGLQALNDVWTFDVGGSLDRMRWEHFTISGCKRPSPCEFKMTNLVRNAMIVVGGGEREYFQGRRKHHPDIFIAERKAYFSRRPADSLKRFPTHFWMRRTMACVTAADSVFSPSHALPDILSYLVCLGFMYISWTFPARRKC
jgi:hypothetical protein